MIAKQEIRIYDQNLNVWIGKYRGLNNLPHWHFDYELCYVQQGEADLFLNGEKYPLKEGQAFLVEERDVHYINSSKDCILAFITFSEDLGKTITNGYRITNPVLRENYDFPFYYEKIKKEIRDKRSYYGVYINSIICELLIRIYRNEQISKAENRESSYINDFSKLLKEIDANYAFYTFEDAADFVNLNKTYFSAMFHKFAGMTFSQYLNRVKIEKAIEMLQTEKNVKITDVAISCGFYTLRNFNRLFKEITGFTPKQLPDGYKMESFKFFSVNEKFNPICSAVLVDSPCAA